MSTSADTPAPRGPQSLTSTPGRTDPRRAALFAVLALAGGVAGAGAKVADELGPRMLADLGTYPAFWLLVVAVVARTAPVLGSAAFRAELFFVPMVLAYYGTALYGFRFPIDGAYALAWGIGAVTACPVLAAALHLAYRSPRAVAGLVPGIAASGAFVDGIVQRQVLALWQPSLLQAARPGQAVADLLIATTVALVLPRGPRARIVAAVALVAGAAVLPALLDRLLYGAGLVG